jgi:hypothetical protein
MEPRLERVKVTQRCNRVPGGEGMLILKASLELSDAGLRRASKPGSGFPGASGAGIPVAKAGWAWLAIGIGGDQARHVHIKPNYRRVISSV